MTAPILSTFGYPITSSEALQECAADTRAYLERPLRAHRMRDGLLWVLLADAGVRREHEGVI